jgi:hypothetical protein
MCQFNVKLNPHPDSLVLLLVFGLATGQLLQEREKQQLAEDREPEFRQDVTRSCLEAMR